MGCVARGDGWTETTTETAKDIIEKQTRTEDLDRLQTVSRQE